MIDSGLPSRLPLLPRAASAAPSEADLEGGTSPRYLDEGPARARLQSRWMGSRLRALVVCALLGSVALFLMARTLALAPHVNAHWRANGVGQIELTTTEEPALRAFQGRALIGLIGGNAAISVIDALSMQPSSRWLVSDSDRERHASLHRELAEALSSGSVRLFFADGDSVEVQPHERGYARLGLMYWLLCGLSLGLYLVGVTVVLARPSVRNLVFAVLALCQAGNLLFIAIETTIELGLPAGFSHWDSAARIAFDLLSSAAVVQAAVVHPTRLPGRRGIAAVAWLVAAVLLGGVLSGRLAPGWWWVQGGVLTLGSMAIALLTWSYRLVPHPFAVLLRRFGLVSVATMTMLTLAVASAETLPGAGRAVANVGGVVWYVFFSSLLLVVPFLSRSKQVLREFALLAAISTVATSLDLLFIAVFSLGPFASLTLALFLSLGVYAGVRQWILSQLLGSSVLTTERMFEQLYRIARELEASPTSAPLHLTNLLRELFEPLEVGRSDAGVSHARVVSDGSTLLVPLPGLQGSGDDGATAAAVPTTLVFRYAQRGRRLFTREDARLTDRLVEQLRRAVAFDRAVEQGRNEERARLAQDLHDDIGARLLTLMYKANDPEMEDYLRHTLQDLKTLTRGLAAANHRLSHAAGEWKADLSQRLSLAHCELDWSISLDTDINLSVVQWSGLTRVLRELVSNIIAHAQATRVSIELTLDQDRLDLSITDDGIGRNPRDWAQGLGLGGVRKRVKQLGGEVEWMEHAPRGIVCRMRILEFSGRH